MLVFVIVDDVVLVLADDVHGAQDIQRIVNSSLHIFEIDLLAHLQFYSSYLLQKNAYLAKLFVHLQDFICDLRTSNHRSFAHLLKHGLRQKHKLLILLLIIVQIKRVLKSAEVVLRVKITYDDLPLPLEFRDPRGRPTFPLALCLLISSDCVIDF